MQHPTRRYFLGAATAVLATPFCLAAPVKHAKRARELSIKRIVVQVASGQRLTPVAPNAYAPYRGYQVSEPVLRIQTAQGLEGISRLAKNVNQQTLQKLIGLDPFDLFEFGENDRIVGPSQQHARLLTDLAGCDVALVDLLGKALNRPAARLLGNQVHDSVLAYDGSVYMEDLLDPAQRQDLVFLNGKQPADPVEAVAKKASWVMNARPEGFKALKIKIGRGKWMASAAEALARDIDVTIAVREAVGRGTRIMVDGNKGYQASPLSAFEYAQGVAACNVHFMEEMFPEGDLPNVVELKKLLRSIGNPIKLAAGESHPGGIVKDVYTQRFKSGERDEPLIDIEQADMNAHGFLYIRSKAAEQAALGMTCAPHNFGSKLGFYAQAHLGSVVPNWEISEVDDSQFPAFIAEGIVLKDGFARLTGAPGLGVVLREEHLQSPKIDIS